MLIRTMDELDHLIKEIDDSSKLNTLIAASKEINTKCKDKESTNHVNCFIRNEDALPEPQCKQALIYTLIKILTLKPKFVDDSVKISVANHFKLHQIKVEGFVSLKNLLALSETEYPLMTWLKYEGLVCHLIKEKLYEPSTVANEVLATVKNDLHPSIAAKFSSVLETCVKCCREASKGPGDEEEKEKWCEIIDWMSWFLQSGEPDDFD